LEGDAPFLETSFIHHSQSLVYECHHLSPPPQFQVPLGCKGALWREMPVSGAFT
jgi:hypothetical protein